MRLITPTIHIKLIEVADKCMIGARLRRILRVQIDPLLLNGLKLCQIVKVDPTFPGVASEEEDTVLEGE